MSELSEKIIALHAEGKSYNQIKEALGCSKGTISYHLGMGQKDKNRVRARKVRNSVKKYIQELKQATPCSDCREFYPYWIMEFDHLRDKSFGIASFSRKTGNLEVVKQEIEKCEIVCANCHRNRTYMRSHVTGSSSLDVDDFYGVD